MIKYYKYVDIDNITRYILTYNGYGFSINYFKLCEGWHTDLKSLNVNYQFINFSNLKVDDNITLSGSSISTLTEKDATKIKDYLNSICILNKLKSF